MKENSIEEDIRKIEIFLTIMKSDFRTGLYYKKYLDAIKHVLEDRERLQKENEELKEENEELRIKNNMQVVGNIAEMKLEDLIKSKYISIDTIKEKIEEYWKKGCTPLEILERLQGLIKEKR